MVFINTIPIEEIDYNYLKSFLSGYKNIRVKINSMLKNGEIIRVKKGLYVPGEKHLRGVVHKETLSNLIYGPSYISLEYALSFYGMIPERVETVTAVTNKKNKSFDTPLGKFTYRYINPDLYPVGINNVSLDEKHNILIAGREKALADILYFYDDLGSLDELKVYLHDNLRIEFDDIQNIDKSVIKNLSDVYGGNVLLLKEYLGGKE